MTYNPMSPNPPLTAEPLSEKTWPLFEDVVFTPSGFENAKSLLRISTE
jgi:hypothetical protein